MPVRLLEPLEVGSYLTDGKRLLWLMTLSGESVLVEDALTRQESLMSVKELSRPRWRRVQRQEAA